MTIQPGSFKLSSTHFGSPPPPKVAHQMWTPQPMRKTFNSNNNTTKNNNSNNRGQNHTNSNTVLQFWQSQEQREVRSQMTSWASSPRLTPASIETERGFMPSDVTTDPKKKEFLTDLSKKIFCNTTKSKSLVHLHKRLVESSSSSRLDQHLTSGGGGSLLDKVMTPSADYDSSSLKRRNPRQMFTDSAFYSPKFHPSVADQVEMAHRLSSSLYEDGNKMSKGQEMYLKRMKKSGVDISEFEEPPHHDKVPNLKLVMNPEGKLHDWTDVPEDELPELQQIAVGGPSAEIAHNLVENLQTCKGRGRRKIQQTSTEKLFWILLKQ